MKVAVVMLALAACKYPDPGGSVAIDAPPGALDGPPDDTLPQVECPEPMGLTNQVQVPGQAVAGFSPAEDESFAISWITDGTPGFTESPLGVTYMPTVLTETIDFASLTPDGSAMYLFVQGAAPGQKVKRAVRTGDVDDWEIEESGITEDNFPGRPTQDDQHMFMSVVGGRLGEWKREGGVWTLQQNWDPPDFGHDSTYMFRSGSLSPDGKYLLYTLEGQGGPTDSGINVRVAVNGSFAAADSAYGRGLAPGAYREATFTAGCTHVYAFNYGSGRIDRFDVTP